MPSLQRRVIRIPGLKTAAMAWLLLAGWLSGITLLQPMVVAAFQTNLSELPITFPVQSPEVALYFAEIARPQDVAAISPSDLQLLPPDIAGHRMLAYRSWADAERELDTLVDQIDMVMYNPEHWELTPSDEQQDLVATVQQFAEFVHARGLRFMFAPDRRYAEEYLSEVAPYVDLVLLQGQRLQEDPQAFASWVQKMIEVARTANSEIQVYVQVGATLGTALDMYSAIQTVSDDIDGIAIWSMPRSLNILQEFVAMLREGAPVMETTSAPGSTSTSTRGGSTESGVPTSTERALTTSTPDEVTALVSPTLIDRDQVTSTAVPTAVSSSGGDVAISSLEEATVEASPTSTVIPASEGNAALVGPDEMMIVKPPTAVKPPLIAITPELEQEFRSGKWFEIGVLILAGMAIGLLLGAVLGFLLGFKLGGRRMSESSADAHPPSLRAVE